MHIKVNREYIYDPVLLDIVDPPYNVKKGERVKVVNLPGCPRAGTMGMCHVQHAETGKFAGLVCINSLKPIQ